MLLAEQQRHARSERRLRFVAVVIPTIIVMTSFPWSRPIGSSTTVAFQALLLAGGLHADRLVDGAVALRTLLTLWRRSIPISRSVLSEGHPV